MKALLLLATLALPLAAAIDGTVVNKSTGQPQPGVLVHVTKMAQGGMEPAGSAKSGPDGRFTIQAETNSPHLLQAVWQGVSYSQSLAPGAPSTGIEVAVFDAAKSVKEAVLTQHMILIETDGKELVVNETVIYQNDGATTWNDPDRGTLRFFIPEAAGTNIMARATSPGGMPVEREPRKLAEKGAFTLDFPIKPGGETRFDISYKFTAEPLILAGKILHGPGPVRLVVPQGIAVGGDGLKPLGTEPQTQAQIYEVEKPAYEIKITGAGSLKSTQPTQREEDGPTIQQIQPPGYQRWWKWALALILAFLALSFWAQWLQQPGGSKPKA